MAGIASLAAEKKVRSGVMATVPVTGSISTSSVVFLIASWSSVRPSTRRLLTVTVAIDGEVFKLQIVSKSESQDLEACSISCPSYIQLFLSRRSITDTLLMVEDVCADV